MATGTQSDAVFPGARGIILSVRSVIPSVLARDLSVVRGHRVHATSDQAVLAPDRREIPQSLRLNRDDDGSLHHRNFGIRLLLMVILLIAARAFAGAPTSQPIRGGDGQPLVFHLPGIGGYRMPDVTLTRGLRAGGLDAEIYIYDWTGEDEGLNALTNAQRHEEQSRIVAEKIAEVVRRQPDRRVILSCHSAGAGIAAWALEQLPDDVQIDTWLLIAPAVSPEFDLSRALSHVRGSAYSFNSSLDPVLGFGTRNFGTIDRVKSDSAGRDGFIRPTGADARLYEKLEQFQYDSSWLRLGHPGEHIGATSHAFARRMIAPLLLSGRLPVLSTEDTPAATQPMAAPGGR